MRAIELVTEEKQEKQSILQRIRGEKPLHRRFTVAPAVLYPTMAEYIKTTLQRQDRPADTGLQRYYSMAKRLYNQRDDAFDLVLKSRGDCDGQSEYECRYQALEVCRLWFTRMLHIEISERPMVIHILEDRRFRL